MEFYTAMRGPSNPQFKASEREQEFLRECENVFGNDDDVINEFLGRKYQDDKTILDLVREGDGSLSIAYRLLKEEQSGMQICKLRSAVPQNPEP